MKEKEKETERMEGRIRERGCFPVWRRWRKGEREGVGEREREMGKLGLGAVVSEG